MKQLKGMWEANNLISEAFNINEVLDHYATLGQFE